MGIYPHSDENWERADPAHFTGSARVQRVVSAPGPPRIKTYLVEFQPGARTHWHSHSGVQLLIVLKGRCLVQKWAKAVRQVEAGGQVSIAPGEKHWHGAAPGAAMAHVAVNVDASTTWMEAVH
ncbi:MAG: cupin domain-containing protein [Acidobacteriota bacterium]